MTLILSMMCVNQAEHEDALLHWFLICRIRHIMASNKMFLNTHVTVTTKTNERAMEQFAKNFAPDVEVLKPESMREKLREELERAAEVYRKREVSAYDESCRKSEYGTDTQKILAEIEKNKR